MSIVLLGGFSSQLYYQWVEAAGLMAWFMSTTDPKYPNGLEVHMAATNPYGCSWPSPEIDARHFQLAALSRLTMVGLDKKPTKKCSNKYMQLVSTGCLYTKDHHPLLFWICKGMNHLHHSMWVYLTPCSQAKVRIPSYRIFRHRWPSQEWWPIPLPQPVGTVPWQPPALINWHIRHGWVPVLDMVDRLIWFMKFKTSC